MNDKFNQLVTAAVWISEFMLFLILVTALGGYR